MFDAFIKKYSMSHNVSYATLTSKNTIRTLQFAYILTFLILYYIINLFMKNNKKLILF